MVEHWLLWRCGSRAPEWMFITEMLLNAVRVKCDDFTGAIVVYRDCRRSPFTLDGCPVGTIINIQSARAEFRGTELTDCRPLEEPSCTRSISHPAILNCNGQHTCSFGLDVLDYPQHNRFCDHSSGNFIWIEYNCTTSKKHVNTS